MDIDTLVSQVTPEIYERMKRAIETGKWPDGARLSNEQRDNCLQLVIAWDARNLPEHERTGWLPAKPAPGAANTAPERPLRFLEENDQ